MESILNPVFKALGEVHEEKDYDLYKFGLADLVPCFQRLGAIRCFYLCSKPSSEAVTSTWCRISYPCLIELFVEFLLYMDFERKHLDMVAEVESFMNYAHVVNLNREFLLDHDEYRIYCLGKYQLFLGHSQDDLL